MNHLRYAIRLLRKSPVFTAVAVITLALGIGANSAIFTLLDQVLIRPLPVSHPEQLVRLRYTGESPGHTNNYGGDDNDFFSYPMYRDLRDKNAVFSGLIANDEQTVGVEWNNRSELAGAEMVSGNYFQMLGLQPAMGRLLIPSDDQPNASPVVVLSFNYWKDKLGSDPRVLGQSLSVNAHPFTIVGVAPPQFHSVAAGETPGLFVPASAKNIITPRWQNLEDRESHWLTLVGRLKDGESRQQAQAGLDPLWRAIRAEELKQFGYHSQRTRRLFLDESHILVLDSARGFSPLRDDIGTPLLVLMGMAGLLVLMACINVSSLLLVRAAARAREMSVRYAIGASRWQILRQLLLEGLLLGLVGGTLGLFIAPLISGMLVRMVFTDPASQLPFSTAPDTRILLFNFAVAFAVSMLFSLAPALRLLRPDLVNSLKQQAATAPGGPLRFRRISVGAQIGLSLLLLVAAGLFVRTLRNLRAVDVGFATDHLVSFRLNARLAGYQPEQLQPLNLRILDTLAALPGVRSVAATDDPDLANNDETGNVAIAGYKQADGEDMQIEEPWITPGYFSTMHVPLLAGRAFTGQDLPGKPNVAIVNASFATHYFGSPQKAIGRVVGFNGSGRDAEFDTEIVGVVGDTRHANLRDPVRRTVYRSLLQAPQLNFVTYVVRTWQPPEAAKSTLREAMQQLDSKLALNNMQTMEAQVNDSLSNERLIAVLSISFGALAALMAAIGLYGVLAYATAQRTREIGIRIALGAQRQTVMRLVLADVAWLAGISIAIALPVAVLASRAVRSQLYNVSSADPLVLVCGVLLITFIALLAALLPARRAARVEPMQALRME
ncbi:MAG TPA: ABC transporter permease [Terriglobales bacterium]|nr:ABC transporter permease [Terriglobales bacterium]